MQDKTAHACSVKYDRIVPILFSEVSISQAFTPTSTTTPGQNLKEFRALWDTGATNTVITEKVVKSCGLKPVGMTNVNTASGTDRANVYLVSIYLPNRVCIPQLRVSELKINNADVLIGMDVIHRGDFAVTNNEGKTTLSFRLPSIECIDFVKQQPSTIQSGLKTLTKVGRNAPCPCGSGKKYKHCCGK